MKTTLLSAVILTASTLLTTSLSAQLLYKPKPSESLEILLPAEATDAANVGRVQGNMRMSLSTGKPAAIYQGTFKVNALATPEEQAREYLTSNKSLFGLGPAEIQALRLHAVRTDEAGSVVRLRQTWKGIPVNRDAEITVHITPDNIVDFVQNGFVYNIALSDITPVKSLQSARQQVFDRLQISGPQQYERNELMVLHHNNADYLVHRIVFISDVQVGEWEAYVDAKSGELLKLEDIALYHKAKKKRTYAKENKPFPASIRPQVFDFNAPVAVHAPDRVTAVVDGTGTVFEPDGLSRARAVYRWSGTVGTPGFIDNSDADSPELSAQVVSVVLKDITLTGSTYSLVGPRAAYSESESPSKPAGTYTTTNGNFSVTRNSDRFEAVMCYYHVDNQMRHLVDTLGLALMPSQYSGGVRFDPHGLSGADNSHYTSGSGAFAMGEGGVDDAEDADVIIHELGHGLHDWAVTGSLSQVQGLSEGTGDYNAGTYSRTKGNWNTADSQYNFQYNWDGHNPFYAGRELNYAGIYPAGLTGEVHADGRIWAFANLRIAAAIGRNRSDRVFWRGMMMTNSGTNQNDAAIAVYQMAITLNYTNAERIAIYNNYVSAGYTMPALVLPVKLESFSAAKTGKQTLVSWMTATEESSQSFVVERSANGMFFTEVGTVAAAGNSTIVRNYSFTDIAPFTGNNYYRLKSVSIDGTSTYSKVVLVVFGKTSHLEIYPNPVKDVLTIKNSFTSGTVSLYDMNGKQVRKQTITAANAGGINMNLTGLPNGMYLVKLENDGEILQSKIMKK